MVDIISGKTIIETIKEYDVILFGMSINNAMNRGLLKELAINFHALYESENRTGYGDRRKYGTVHCTEINGKLFCACYMNNNKSGGVKYDMLRRCLEIINKNFNGKRILSPIIGSNYYDGEGEKNTIIGIYNEVFTDCDITLLDYEQRDFSLEIYKLRNELYKKKKENKLTKEEFLEQLRILEWRKNNGDLNDVPENFTLKPKKSFKNLV